MGNLTINGRKVAFDQELNLLEVIRKAGIELPTFCYHSELSVYGGCRMCVVDVEGMGVVGACSTGPRDGMVLKTHTQELRNIRKLALELLLADHDRECTTCEKSGLCKLQELATQLGVHEIRFGERDVRLPKDETNASIVRDPNKCILCGDCVRMCEEIQGVGALGFINRGSEAQVVPAFDKKMDEVECVNCGQCMAVCPTGALVVKSQTTEAFDAINDETKTVVVQIAPAVRVAIGEAFGLPAGENLLGKMVTALKMLGVDRVFDTSIAADLTVLEEMEEFFHRLEHGGAFPMFTSCCPAWVKFAEYKHPEMLNHLSTCRSPQQMFGAIVKGPYAQDQGVDPKDLYVISIMPCTAKKFEAARPEFVVDGQPDVDLVLTTQEVAAMIKEAGIDFAGLPIESLDSPLGFATGAGIMFGNSGGVSEAVLRYAADRLTGQEQPVVEYEELRGDETAKILIIPTADRELRLGVVHGLQQADELIAKIHAGELMLDLIEVMACPGGCTGGAGQPQSTRGCDRRQRVRGLYDAEKMTQLRKAQHNPALKAMYDGWFEHPGSAVAHEKLHTEYHSRRRMLGEDIALEEGRQVEVKVCLGTFCYLHGSYDILKELTHQLEQEDLHDCVNLQGTFCFEQCNGGPSVQIGDELLGKVTVQRIPELIGKIQTQLTEG